MTEFKSDLFLWIYLCLNLVGWRPDDYFREKTQYIFNNMVVKLKEDPWENLYGLRLTFEVVGNYRCSEEGMLLKGFCCLKLLLFEIR